MFQDMFAGQGSSLIMAIGVVALALVALFLVFWFMRARSTSTFIRGGRNRQPRLAVLDAAAVDARRRLVLIRRDDVEHLIMIGGPTDLVIESRIVPVEAGQPEAQKPVAIPATVTMPAPRPQPVQARPEPTPEPVQKAAPVREPAAEPAAAAAPVIDRRPEPAQQPERPVMLATRVEPSTPPVAAPAATSPEAGPSVTTSPAASAPASTPASPQQSEPVRAPAAPAAPPAPSRKAAQSAHSFATTTPFASRATPAWVPQPGTAAENRGHSTGSAAKPDKEDVRETAMDALDAARSRVLPTAAAATTAAAASAPAASAPSAPASAKPAEEPEAEPAFEPTIDYNAMESDGDDFESILEAELSSDLSDLDLGPPRPLPQQQTRPDQPTDKTKSRDELQEEMERLLGDLSIRP